MANLEDEKKWTRRNEGPPRKFIEGSSKGNQINVSSVSISSPPKKENEPLPIETPFNLPSPLPPWPQGEGFASGIIDLGGLQVCQVSTFTVVWATKEGGPDNLGATFFEPCSLPDEFFLLGFYSQSNNRPLSGWVLAAKDATSEGLLKEPVDYILVWSSESLNINQDGVGYIWLPIPPDGYIALGHVVTSSPEKPAVDKIRCVRSDFTDSFESDDWIWGPDDEIDTNEINVYSTRPSVRGIQAMGIPTGTFITQKNGAAGSTLVCLKNANASKNALPNSNQIKALIQAYSPYIYFHPDENYLPSSLTWFFENGALLYTKGQESNPIAIDSTGSNLPQGGGNDGSYWIDLPMDDIEKERVKLGDLQDAYAYLHVKPMFGATFTDIAIWIFYPFNGPSRAKVGFFNVHMGKIGEHVGDWEHVTLRISNFNGELKAVYFSQHNKGVWVEASELEFENGNKPVVYSSLHGHASYPKPGLVLLGKRKMGIRDDTGKGTFSMDTGEKFSVVNADYMGSMYENPPWLNYTREWGPKISYEIEDELKVLEMFLPGKLKPKFENFVLSLPQELLGEEGPTGPMVKDNGIWQKRVSQSVILANFKGKKMVNGNGNGGVKEKGLLKKNVIEGEHEVFDGEDRNENDFWDTVEIAREDDVVIPRAVATHHDVTVTRRIYEERHESGGSSHAGPSTRSSNCSRVVPDDEDLHVDQLFDTKRDLQEAAHRIAMKHNFEFKLAFECDKDGHK
ncbi:uncharacterized protein LOC111411369 [Olea europaea var. sylvestris]|uniref:uncharacterized protein LOC111411369 n=1 Tax=Olea europaea var. sylvestris TaxID=158386 RepID=UPI000C1D7BF5|nr:uncharacterized protein LOC111411369 [Olea europaea var. sylvestris]